MPTGAHALALSATGLALTGGIELVLAVLTHSVGLLSDALHNLSDVSTSALVFFGFRVSKRPPSTRFTYGYERAEDMAGLGVALVIWGSAAFSAVESYRKLVTHSPTTHLGWGMVGAVVGIVGNQVVARYKGAVGKRIQSVRGSSPPPWSPTLDTHGSMPSRRSAHSSVSSSWRWAVPWATQSPGSPSHCSSPMSASK